MRMPLLVGLTLLGCGGAHEHNTELMPPTDSQNRYARSTPSAAGGKQVAVVKMCLTRDGKVKSLKILKTAGDVYDAKIKRKMWKWKYKPFLVNGKAVPVCNSVTFTYIPDEDHVKEGGVCSKTSPCHKELSCTENRCALVLDAAESAPAKPSESNTVHK